MKTGNIRKIILLGAGNLATWLGFSLQKNGIEILQIYSRTEESARTLGEKLQVPYTTSLSAVFQEADAYIFSLKDDVLPFVLKELGTLPGVCMHTAGSIASEIFKEFSANYGVLYPLQTFSKNKYVSFQEIPVFIEGNTTHSKMLIKDLAEKISTKVHFLNSQKRKYLHLSAVFACNFTNHLYEITEKILNEEDMPFDYLIPLINETASKVNLLSPHEAQTGPALRYDKQVIEAHLQLIKDEKIRDIYALLTESIHRFHKR